MKNTTFTVDFKNKKVLKVEQVEMEVKKETSLHDFSNFNPIIKGSNFEAFSAQERFEYSEHVLAHISDCTIEDIVHWVNNGMVDKKKLNKKLGLHEEDQEDIA